VTIAIARPSSMGIMKTALLWLAGRALRIVPEGILGRLLPGSLRFTASDVPKPPSVRQAAVRLYVGPVNWAGQGARWARAAEENLPDVAAVNSVYRMGADFSHPADNVVPVGVYVASRRWQRAQWAAVRDGFSHVLVEAERQPFGAVLDESVASQVERMTRHGLAVAMLCHGSDIRSPSRHAAANPDSPFRAGLWSQTPKLERDTRRNRGLLRELALPVFVSTPDLLLDVPEARWLPVVVEVERWASPAGPLEREIPIVAHAPSKGVVKGSDLVDPVLRALEAEGLISYRRVQGVPVEEMYAVYRDADVVLDQFRLGDYGVAAVEAMAAGRVVVAHVNSSVRDLVRDTTGLELPIVEATAHDLDAVLRGILSERTVYRDRAAAGVVFAAEVHDGRRSARVLAPFLTPLSSTGDRAHD